MSDTPYIHIQFVIIFFAVRVYPHIPENQVEQLNIWFPIWLGSIEFCETNNVRVETIRIGNIFIWLCLLSLNYYSNLIKFLRNHLIILVGINNHLQTELFVLPRLLPTERYTLNYFNCLSPGYKTDYTFHVSVLNYTFE